MTRRAPIHPGRVLLLEFLEPIEMTPSSLATALHVPRNRVTRLVNGQSSMTTDTGFRLAQFFGNSPRFWLNLQSAYEVRCADALAARLADEISPWQEIVAAQG
jgi:addiction module HigA family antidote